MKQCRDCQGDVSEQAMMCPNCGAPYPAREKWDGYGYEYKSRLKANCQTILPIWFLPKIGQRRFGIYKGYSGDYKYVILIKFG